MSSEQLSGLDAAFIHQDSRRTPMHVCAVLIYDIAATGNRPISTRSLRQRLEGSLGQHPLFARRLRRVPMDLDTPYWTAAGNWHWQEHFSEHHLPAYCDWEEFHGLLDRIHSSRMDLAKPLWELHLIHNLDDLPGLPDTCQALVLKAHHAAIDGVSLATLIRELHQDEPGNAEPELPDQTGPDLWRMWTRTNIRTVERQFKFAETMNKLIPGVVRAIRSREQFADLPPVHTRKAAFNTLVEAGRHTGSILLPMDEVLAIKRSVRRVTLNDIALACVSGGLRHYLGERGALPSPSLVAGVPVNLRKGGQQTETGNQIATMRVGLATHEEDPVERLRLIHRYAVAGKKQLDALGTGTIMDISDSVSPNILSEGIRTLAWASQLAGAPVPFHTMVSNVPGPGIPLQLAESELAAILGLGPVRDNMGLFHIVTSCRDRLGLSFSACAKLLPDHQHYRRCLWSAYEQLRAAAL